MSNSNASLIGQFVKALRGRDQDQYAVIVGVIDEKFVLIADGDKRKFDRPKKKNLHHLQQLQVFSDEVVESLLANGRVTNGKLRYVLEKFQHSMISEAHEKGE